MKKLIKLVLALAVFFAIIFPLPVKATIEQQTYYDSWAIIEASSVAGDVGQHLNILDSTVSSLSFYLKKTGSPTGNVTFMIRSAPSTASIADILVPISSINSTGNWVTANLTSPVYINESVYISVKDTYSGTYPTDVISVGYLNSDNKSGECYTQWNGETWTDYTGKDTAYQYEYAVGSTALPVITTDSANLTYNMGSTQMWQLKGSVISTGTSGNIVRSFNIGTTNGTWESNAGILTTTSNNTGEFVEVATGLLPNTTYYYQAFAYYPIDLYHVYYGYGDIKSFTTSNGTIQIIPPSVQTISAVYDSVNSTFSLTGSVVFSVLPIIQRGFGYGSLGTITSNISQSGTYGMGGTWSMSIPVSSFPTGSVYQAWAKDSAGSIGYGSILTATASPASGSNVTMVSATFVGTSVSLVGSLNSIGYQSPLLRGFAWSTTNNVSSAIQWWEAISPPATIGQFTHNEHGLNSSTLYYFWAGVYSSGTWAWSSPITSMSGSTSNVTLFAPAVTTNQPSSVTVNSVNASLTITQIAGLLGFGVAQIDSYGFDVGLQSGVYTDYPRQAGSFDVGSYWMMLSSDSWHDGTIIYLRAYAHNTMGKDARGIEIPVKLSNSGFVPLPPTPSNSSITDFSFVLRQHMASLGMDNSTGHWAYMLLLELIVAIVFIFIVVWLYMKDEKFIARIASVIWLLVALIIFGAFVFSGLLSIWAVVILIIAAIGVIIYTVSTVLTGRSSGGE